MDTAEFIKMAEENHCIIAAAADQRATLAEIIQVTDIVMGVYPDNQSALGFSTYLIKGRAELSLTVQSAVTAKHTITAVPCRELEAAIAMERVLGDGRLRQ